jgi:hypothetical protein
MNDAFSQKYEEKAEYNQYWYSPFTIQKMADEVVLLGGKAAFLSTPSIYFSIPESDRGNCHLFDVSQRSIDAFALTVLVSVRQRQFRLRP